MFLLLVPQMYYWHYLSGKWILYSYSEQGFDHWKSPKIYEVFFHLCNGFLPYTPLMAFALVGLVIAAYRNFLNSRLIVGVFVVLTYLCASWWSWWFGGTYGYRSFTDYYPILAFGLAYYLNLVFESRFKAIKVAHLFIFFLLSFYSFRMITECCKFQVEPDGRNSELFLPAVKKCFWIK